MKVLYNPGLASMPLICQKITKLFNRDNRRSSRSRRRDGSQDSADQGFHHSNGRRTTPGTSLSPRERTSTRQPALAPSDCESASEFRWVRQWNGSGRFVEDLDENSIVAPHPRFTDSETSSSLVSSASMIAENGSAQGSKTQITEQFPRDSSSPLLTSASRSQLRRKSTLSEQTLAPSEFSLKKDRRSSPKPFTQPAPRLRRRGAIRYLRSRHQADGRQKTEGEPTMEGGGSCLGRIPSGKWFSGSS
ncbi:hypothetical protein F5Y16DRAFT_351215 [Xylariaceae sp. FL0255]|nr:hypothetical protein F5Y16DRAFT_351215 [Xylariaceae sp. FL0255]